MKSLLIYDSNTGNTEMLAGAAMEVLAGEYIVADAVTEVGDYDLVAVGFWFQGGGPDAYSSKVLEKLAGKKVFLFASHGAEDNSPAAQAGMAKAVKLTKGADIVGTFSCPGQVGQGIQKQLANKDPQPPWLSGCEAAVGHPDEQDLKNLQEALKVAIKNIY